MLNRYYYKKSCTHGKEYSFSCKLSLWYPN